MTAFDIDIFRIIYGIGSGSPGARAVSVFLATWLIVLASVLAIGALIAAWPDRARRLEITAAYLRALAASALGYVGNALIALVIVRARPFAALGLESLIGAPLTAKSFPSDHATLAFAIATTFAFAWPQHAWRWFVPAALVALGRVLVGVHFPTDVVAGALIGAAWAWAVQRFDVREGNALSLRAARSLTQRNRP